jgi:hypothetical protein
MSAHEHLIHIAILADVIWRKLAERRNWYSVQLKRGYKTDEGRRDTDNLGYDDLLPAAKLLDMAHTWVMHQLAADAKGRQQADKVTAK